MSAISEIGGYWMEGALRTLDAVRNGFGAPSQDPPGATPYRVIFESGKVSLRHYPAQGPAHHTPVLLIYSLIKRSFILDLLAGRSVIENLVKQGFDVYLIDWLPPVPSDTWRGFDAYVNQDMRNAVRAVQIHSGVERISMLGYCFGALLALIYTALHQETIKNLVTLTVPLDMSKAEIPIEKLSASMTETSARLITDMFGNVPSWVIFSFFNTLAPTHHLLDKFVVAYRNSGRKGFPDTFRLFEKWLHSDVPFAKQIFLETAIELGKNNALVKGAMKVGGQLVDLKSITASLLNVIGDRDDIVNPNSSRCLPELVSSTDKFNLHYPTGHMGAAISADSLKKLWPMIGNWLTERDD